MKKMGVEILVGLSLEKLNEAVHMLLNILNLQAAGSNITMVIVRELTRTLSHNTSSSRLPPVDLLLGTPPPPPTTTLPPPAQLRSPLATSSPPQPALQKLSLLQQQQQQLPQQFPQPSLEEGSSLNLSRDSEDLVVRVEKIYTTLLRDSAGLGFSIAGGVGATPYRNNITNTPSLHTL